VASLPPVPKPETPLSAMRADGRTAAAIAARIDGAGADHRQLARRPPTAARAAAGSTFGDPAAGVVGARTCGRAIGNPLPSPPAATLPAAKPPPEVVSRPPPKLPPVR